MIALIKIRQTFDRTHIPDEQIERVVKQQFHDSGVVIPQASRLAIAVGSRGITNLPRIVRAVAQCVQEQGGKPFLVPAMGSHGGATAEGQRQILESYGITEQAMDAPIHASMEVVELPSDGLPNKVYMDKLAYEADGTIVINRVKVHTAFHGDIESGLLKMCVIGLGKHKGALELHSYGAQGLRELISPTARQILVHGNILLGFAIAENAYEETAMIKAVLPEDFEREEKTMLQWVKQHMPRLPVDQLDVLIVEEFGKHISGTGMDVNIIGRLKIATEPEPDTPKITSIILLDLSNKSHGNANGMGLADVITRRFFKKIDFQATYENILTTGFLERGKMPLIAETEEQALEYALKPCGIADPAQARIIRIKNTLTLDELWVSQKVLEELRSQEHIEVTDESMDL
jgi:hypothetical protein